MTENNNYGNKKKVEEPKVVTDSQQTKGINEKVELPPTICPIVIKPYVDMGNSVNSSYTNNPKLSENLSGAENKSAINVNDNSISKKPKTGKIRFCGFLMMVIALISFTPFILSMIRPYPFPTIKNYIGVNNLIVDLKLLINQKQYITMELAMPIYLYIIGLFAVLVIFLKSLTQLFGGKRRGYITWGLIALVTFVMSALLSFGFDNLNNFDKLLSYPKGFIYLTLILIGIINFLFGLVCSLACPSRPIKLDY